MSRRKRKRRGSLLWLALAVLVAGFLAHRMIENGAVREASRMPAKSPRPIPLTQQPAPQIAADQHPALTAAPVAGGHAGLETPPGSPTREDITNRDRQTLDRILRNKDR